MKYKVADRLRRVDISVRLANAVSKNPREALFLRQP
jgi:hypothetical protein